MKQWPDESNAKYKNRFENTLHELEIHAGEEALVFLVLVFIPADLPEIKEEGTDADKKGKERMRTKMLDAAQKGARKNFVAVCFIYGLDDERYRELKKKLGYADSVEREETPETLQGAYDLLQNEADLLNLKPKKKVGGFRNRPWNNQGGGASFAQEGAGTDSQGNKVIVAGTNGVTKPDVLCFKCRCYGHIATFCPQATGAPGNNQVGIYGSFLLNCSYLFAQMHGLPKSLILLDTCSTHTCTNNANFVDNLVCCSKENVLTMNTNGGPCVYDKRGSFKHLPLNMYYNQNSIATVLSFWEVINIPNVFVYCDTRQDTSIFVIYLHKVYRFHVFGLGLFGFDTETDNVLPLDDKLFASQEYSVISNTYNQSFKTPFSYLSTVNNNKRFFGHAEIEGADTATELQCFFFWPGTPFFKNIFNTNSVRNSTITCDDVTRRDKMYGPPITTLQGKKMHLTPPKHDHVERMRISVTIPDEYLDATLCIDIVYVNTLFFLHTKTKKVNYCTIHELKRRTLGEIKRVLKLVLELYTKRGFQVKVIKADPEFESDKLKAFVIPTYMDIHAKGEHVGVIERGNRTLKEQCRSTVHGLPYRVLPKVMVKKLVKTGCYWINSFPSENGISDTMRRALIVEGRPSPDLSKKRICFGAYAQVYTGTDNSNKSRMVDAIALGPLNEAGGFEFMSLITGDVITGHERD